MDSNSLSDDHLTVAAASDRGMALTRGAFSCRAITCEPHPLALVAPPPALLARARLMGNRIISASRLGVLGSCRTWTRWITAEPEALALTAPAPVGLARSAGRLMNQTVVPAPGLRMIASTRALPGRISAEP